MPRRVINEMITIAHPDLPGAWAGGIRGKLQFTLDVEDSYMKHVMKIAGDVVDPNKGEEDADPYVVAMAYELSDKGHRVCVVTNDTVDRDNLIAVSTACERLSLEWCGIRDFLTHLGIPLLKE